LSELVQLIDLSISTWLIVSVIVFVAAIVQGALGMGFGQVSASLLILVAPGLVPATVIMMGMVVSMMGAVQGYRKVNVREMSVALVGRIIGGVLAGHVMFLLIESEAWSLLFAGMILLAVFMSIITWKVMPTDVTLFSAGTLSGFMGTITSIGAPPIGIVYQNVPGAEARATMNAFFALGTIASLTTLWVYGIAGWTDVARALSLAPGFLAGYVCAQFMTSFIDSRFRTLVLVICVLSAVSVIFKTLV
jgi:uncharacterized protein